MNNRILAWYNTYGRYRAKTKKEDTMQKGLTLVEMIVVLGLVALLSAIALPVMYRMGPGATNKPQLAAREIYTHLRAARQYAATHNVDAGLAYLLTTWEGKLVIRGYAPVREHSLVDWNSHQVVWLKDAEGNYVEDELGNWIDVTPRFENLYTFVEEPGTRFTILDEGAYVVVPALARIPEDGYTQIHLYESDGDLKSLADNIVHPLPLREDYEQILQNIGGILPTFPAHIFRPNGTLISKSPKQTFNITVSEENPYVINIQATTGRIAIQE